MPKLRFNIANLLAIILILAISFEKRFVLSVPNCQPDGRFKSFAHARR